MSEHAVSSTDDTGGWAGTGGLSAGDAGGMGGSLAGGASVSSGGAAGAATSDSSCGSLVWGAASDPGYRGLRGTFNGQALNVDGNDVDGVLAFCFTDGPGPTPTLGAYVPLPGLSLQIDDPCHARVTSADDTTWHDLQMKLAGAMATPIRSPYDAYDNTVTGGHLHLEGQALTGPVVVDADFYLNVSSGDTCGRTPLPPR